MPAAYDDIQNLLLLEHRSHTGIATDAYRYKITCPIAIHTGVMICAYMRLQTAKDQTEKDEPHPQVDVAFGLFTIKRAPSRPSR